jgi:hypothetical protein
MLRRLIPVLALCLMTLPALCQSASKWQIATITEVKPRPAAGEDVADAVTYDVTVKVGDTIYVVRYSNPAGEIPPRYAAGRDLLVFVGKTTISYNDMLGRTLEVPIVSQKAASEPKQSK